MLTENSKSKLTNLENSRISLDEKLENLKRIGFDLSTISNCLTGFAVKRTEISEDTV